MIVDIIIIGILLLAIVLGMKKGLISCVIDIVAVINTSNNALQTTNKCSNRKN